VPYARVARLVSLVLVAACTPKDAADKPFAHDPKAEADLMEADRAFAQRTADRGIDGWLDLFAEDGVELPEGAPLARGKEEVRAVMAPLLSDPSNRLRWEPDEASVSRSGDLGYTLGHATVSKVLPSGQEATLARLKYATIWKRQADGHWKVAVDVGTPEP
jgi:uncharacterized protein (TIGR02246 family)